jgi:glutamine synthetase
VLDTGVMTLPKLPRDAGDRNRTSPFAFTGNKFEFRAVSSNQSIAYPNIALNIAVTDSLDYIAGELEKATRAGKKLEQAVGELLPKLIKENKQIIFNGNNYSKEWEKEAGKRGLLNLKNTVDALPQLVSKETVALFERYRVLNEREVHARYEIMVETYNKTVNVEGQLMVLMANRYILPAALEYQRQVAASVSAVKAAGGRSIEGKKVLDQLTGLVDQLKQRSDRLAKLLDRDGNGSSEKHAKHFRDVVIPAMAALRETGDAIELVMPHETWPLATYREMLFIK